MNIEGYRMYLASMGNIEKFINGEISRLVMIEQTLCVDLDDYIPYNGEYSRVTMLEAAMLEHMPYSEDVQNSLDKYVGYKLHNLNESV